MSTIISEDRYSYLDGLRGIASLAVFFWHFFLAFYPYSIMPSAPSHFHFLEKNIYPSPLNIFFGGDLAVFIFFTLSGFVMSISFFKKESTFPNNMFLRRYIRLMPAAAVNISRKC